MLSLTAESRLKIRDVDCAYSDSLIHFDVYATAHGPTERRLRKTIADVPPSEQDLGIRIGPPRPRGEPWAGEKRVNLCVRDVETTNLACYAKPPGRITRDREIPAIEIRVERAAQVRVAG